MDVYEFILIPTSIIIGLFGILALSRSRRTQWVATLAFVGILSWFVFLFTPEVSRIGGYRDPESPS